MKYSEFGLTGLRVSRVSFGCAAIGGYDYGAADDKESIAAIRQAVEEGMNFFDTADVYGLGHSEEVLGKGLAGLAQEIIVATKVGVRWNDAGHICKDLSKQWIYQAVEGSLRRLRLETIPLYQIHWPNLNTPLEETLEALVTLQNVGKIRYIGCCNFDSDLIARSQMLARLESIQLPYSILETNAGAVFEECCATYQMAGLSYNTLAHGLFSGKYNQETSFEGSDLRRRSEKFRGECLKTYLGVVEDLKRQGVECGRSSSELAIRWVLDNPAVTSAIVGVRTQAQAVDNARSAN